MFELLLKSSFAIGIAFLFYKLLLQQESFFATNRFYLIGCLALAFALPFVSLPKLISHQGYLATVFQQAESVDESIAEESIAPTGTYSQQSISVPERASQRSEVKPPQTAPASAATQVAEATQTATSEISWGFWVLILYLFGVAVFALSLLFQVGSIFYKIFTATDKIEDGDCVIVNTTRHQAPCSFFKYIFIYPDDYDYETYEQIIAHEKVHARLGHSFDLLVAEIAVVILWFNPLVWLFKREIEKNNEYQTDALLLEKEQVKKDQYQLNLLQIAVPNKPLSITTNYNQSLLKQRIMMMNAKKSTAHAYWKYAFMVPLFFGAILFMNEPANSYTAPISALNGGEQMQTLEEQIIKNLGAPSVKEAKPEAVAKTVDPKQEPAKQEVIAGKEDLKRSIKNKVKNKVKQGSLLSINGKDVDMSEGYWYSNREGDKYCISFKGSKSNSSWNMSDCYDSKLFKKQGNDVFVVTKETGTLQLTGNLDAEVGQGKYKFTEDASFKSYLASKNITSNNKNLMFHLFFGDVDKKYVDYLKKNYSDISGNRLIELAIHGISQQDFQQYLALYQQYNNSKPTTQDIIAARIHGIDQEYIKEIKAAGFKDLSMNKIMEAKIHGVDAAFVESLKKAGFKNLTMDKIISAKIHGINPASIKEVQALGFGELSLDKIIEVKIHGVDAAYVKELRTAGFKDLSLDQYMQAKIHGLDAASVKDIKALGYKDADFRDLLSAQIHGVDKAYIDDLKKAGLKDFSLEEAVSAKIHGINSDFIKKAKKNGYDLNSIDKYISLKIHGMAMESLKEKD
ncbi:M56 family metallopeptidase [Pontibacter sp. KCTC 32443]|uniref:M56 family metallopeptidase n=1 Tax=Pontibacter TaxID=323449 RepID=UPI00164D4B54|nr:MULTISPECIES: M56 family metallopeptidase [Pontibacter]MBC5772718.1 M56 family metallopeptidase [Pontibacter sp. KCTC 32443]